jgi:hypothetical protein
MKKVSIVGSVGLPVQYGCWEPLFAHLTRRFANPFKITVYCSASKYPDRSKECNVAKLNYISLDANGVQSIFV